MSQCQIITYLIARAYNDNVDVAIKKTYTKRSIPLNRNYITSADTARKLPHLASYASKLPLVLNCDIVLLIVYDFPSALKQ